MRLESLLCYDTRGRSHEASLSARYRIKIALRLLQRSFTLTRPLSDPFGPLQCMDALRTTLPLQELWTMQHRKPERLCDDASFSE